MTLFSNLKAVAEVLKKRFPNLTFDETLELAEQILEALGMAR